MSRPGRLALALRVARRLPLAVEAVLAQIAASAVVRLLPPSRTTRILAMPARRRRPPRTGDVAREAQRVGRMVERVARHLPWHPVCLPQALATRWLLQRRGIRCVTHLGVVETRPLAAHAWVTVDTRVVQGGAVTTATEVARFSSAA